MILGIGVGFLTQIVIARLLGVYEFGVYSWVLAWVNYLLMVCSFGLDGLMVRNLPSYIIDHQYGKARGFFLFSIYWVGSIGLLAGLVMYSTAWLLQKYILPGSLDVFAISILVVPLFSLASIREAILRALKHVAKGQLLDRILRPLLLALFAAGLVLLFRVTASAATVMLAQLFSSVMVFAVGGYWVLKALPAAVQQAPQSWDGRSWLKESVPFLAISGASAASRQVVLLILGALSTPADVGLYAAISRIADFSLMGIYAVAAIASPLIVEVLKKRDKIGLAQIMKWGARASFAFSCVALLGIVFFSEWILAAFGKDFVAGDGVLYMMLPGPLVLAFSGMSGYLLSMSGHARIIAASGWFSAVSSFLICIIFVPEFGVYAAAVGYTLPTLFEGIVSLYFCWRYHKVWGGVH